MDKILLFNGCSFTAGDEIVWDQFCKDFTWREAVIERTVVKNNKLTNKEAVDLYLDYVKNFRPTKNLGSICSKILQTKKIDLSLDGNSNDNIALSTINYLMRMDSEKRQKVHVCIGWTSTDRRIKFSKNRQLFQNLHCYSLLDDNKEHHDYTIAAIIENTEVDHSLNYLMNVINLENYLKANNITYTFWRALANETSHASWEVLNKSPSPNDLMAIASLPVYTLSNKENWITFNSSSHPWMGHSWDQTLTDADKISTVNKHPNFRSMLKLSKTITDHIKLQLS